MHNQCCQKFNKKGKTIFYFSTIIFRVLQEIKDLKEQSVQTRLIINPELVFYKNCAHGKQIKENKKVRTFS